MKTMSLCDAFQRAIMIRNWISTLHLQTSLDRRTTKGAEDGVEH